MLDRTYINYLEKSKFLGDATKSTYKSRLQVIQNDIWLNCKSVNNKVGKGRCLHYILMHPEAFLEKLDEYANKTGGRLDKQKLSMHAKDGYVTALKSLFQEAPGLKQKYPQIFIKWDEIHKQVRQPINEKYQSNKPTERQEEAYVSFEELERKRDSLEIGSDARLLLSLYTLVPPLRSDYNLVAIYKNNKDIKYDNYLILNKNPYLVITKYKTAKTYKDIKIDLPKKLVKEIKESLKLKPREFIFVQKNGKPYEKSNTFNRWANRTLKSLFDKKNISLSTLRHIYITRRDLKLEEKSGLERNKIAQMMGHSVGTQQNYLWHTYEKEKNKK
jgi:integrase